MVGFGPAVGCDWCQGLGHSGPPLHADMEKQARGSLVPVQIQPVLGRGPGEGRVRSCGLRGFSSDQPLLSGAVGLSCGGRWGGALEQALPGVECVGCPVSWVAFLSPFPFSADLLLTNLELEAPG